MGGTPALPDARYGGRVSEYGASEPSVTIVIPTRDRPRLIADTLRALLGLVPPNVDIVVVDQSADNATRDVVARAEGGTRLHHYGTSTIGLSAGRNIGYQLATTDLVVYVDDDCIVTEGWLSALVREFVSSDAVAAYGRLIPFEDGPRTGTEVGFKNVERRQEYAGRTPPWHVGHGGNMAFRRRELEDVGGFDELLGAGAPLRSGEDGDIGYRLLARGKRLAYVPDALVHHRHWKSWSAQQAMERSYGVGAGAQFAKYVRCGDLYGIRLFLRWTWELGVRRVGAGLIKWRSWRVVYLGYCQLVYPLIGALTSLGYAVDRQLVVYRAPERGSATETFRDPARDELRRGAR